MYNSGVKKLLIFALLFPLLVSAGAPTFSIKPENIIQGEPLMVQIEGADISDVKSVSFDGKGVAVFLYQGKPTALIGIDLNKKPGVYNLTATLVSLETITTSVTIGKREKVEAPLGIPEKLGGNTPAAQKNLITSLANENYILNNLRTGKKAFWSDNFRFPVESPIVTDSYGYSRKTGEYSIAHKGTDFRAPEGTPVMAMNRGVVRMARQGPIYGKTIVIDHGLGIMTFYMHLSKIKVNEGELVKPGADIGAFGKDGLRGDVAFASFGAYRRYFG